MQTRGMLENKVMPNAKYTSMRNVLYDPRPALCVARSLFTYYVHYKFLSTVCVICIVTEKRVRGWL